MSGREKEIKKERYYKARGETREAYSELGKLLERYKRGEIKKLDDVVQEFARLIADRIIPCLIKEAWAARDYIEELEKKT